MPKMKNVDKPQAVIWYIASRPCLKENLELLYKNFNNKYQYPVLVFTFGKQYGKRYIKNIHKTIDPTIKFVELEWPKIPSHIKEEELFYHKKQIPYVKNCFPKSRLGYLHMIHSVAGKIMKHPEIKKYDFTLKMNDDTFFVEKINFDLFRFVRDNNYKFCPFAVKKYDHERSRQCQIGLRELVKKYIKENKIKPQSNSLDEDGNWDSVCAYDPTIWDLSIFRNQNWKKWWHCVNQSGGTYKYRWGDLEIHVLYLRMYYPDSVWYNFDFYKKGKCKHGGHGPVHHGSKIQRILEFSKGVIKSYS